MNTHTSVYMSYMFSSVCCLQKSHQLH